MRKRKGINKEWSKGMKKDVKNSGKEKNTKFKFVNKCFIQIIFNSTNI